MSADSYSICPKCKKVTVNLIEEVRKLYGKIPPEEYEKKLQEAKDTKVVEPEETLREDYEFYLEGVILNIIYKCACECGFHFSYNKVVNIETGEEYDEG